ncbi:MAG TPA: hypothetical protein EYN53_06505 [Dehalococcoidia bacterium]|nr:hypothetical protein [Dehalococcoidia bacterium]
MDELVELAKTNIVAADSYKGKWVSADGYVSDISQGAISVAGLIGIDSALSGFECEYGSDMESQVTELRVGDSITVTGKLTGWFIFLSYKATIELCTFTVNRSNNSTIGQSNTSVTSSGAESDSDTNIPPDLLYEGCDGLMELISTIPTDGLAKMQLMRLALSGDLEICNSAIKGLTAQMDGPSSADSNVAQSATPAVGGNPDEVEVEIGTGSAAEKHNISAEATVTAEAEQGIFAEGVGSGGEVLQGAAFDVEIPDGPAETGVIVVDIPQIGAEGMVFDPAIVKIKVGATVRWTNNRRSASSSTSDPGQGDSWDSGSFSKGTFDKEAASFEHTFNIPGCFTYKSLFSGDTATGAVCVVE